MVEPQDRCGKDRPTPHHVNTCADCGVAVPVYHRLPGPQRCPQCSRKRHNRQRQASEHAMRKKCLTCGRAISKKAERCQTCNQALAQSSPLPHSKPPQPDPERCCVCGKTALYRGQKQSGQVGWCSTHRPVIG